MKRSDSMRRLAAGFFVGTVFGCIAGIFAGYACAAIGITEELSEDEWDSGGGSDGQRSNQKRK